jgi:hypothetical protein
MLVSSTGLATNVLRQPEPLVTSSTPVASPTAPRTPIDPFRGIPKFSEINSAAKNPFTRATEKPLDIYVIDDFDLKVININRSDWVADVTHGELVATIIEDQIGVTVHRVAVDSETASLTRKAEKDIDTQIIKTMRSIVMQYAKNQGVAPRLARLQGVYLNISYTQENFRSPEAKAKFTEAVRLFSSQGGKIFVGAGNQYRSALADVPGVYSVNGSAGIVGDARVLTNALSVYKNGPEDKNSFTTNSVVVPHRVIGGLSITPNKTLEFTDADITPVRSSWEGKPFSQQNVVMRNMIRVLVGNITKASARAEEKNIDPSDDANTILAYKKLQSYCAGKLISAVDLIELKLIESANGNATELFPIGLDLSKIYLDAALMVAKEGAEKQVLLEVGLQGRMQKISEKGESAKIYGTSFSTPTALSADVMGYLKNKTE